MTESGHILLTERTRMRLPKVTDFDNTLALWSDPAVTRYITGDPLGMEAAWSRLLRLQGHWQALGYGPWIVEDRHTGAFIGEVGFRDYKRNTTPSFAGTPELGWVLRSDLHGKGFATETVLAALAWADAHFDEDRTVCIVSVDHAASIRVAEKVGYKKAADATYNAKPVILFERFRPM